ncbi:MAG: hypothetical protein M0R74_16365, partial [Dehalococcoidia bacterium]|nr:hypothetical protein [Dehalococcoidia bacterium]
LTPELEGQLRRVLPDLGPDLRLREGRMVLEVLPNQEGGKDRALLALAKHYKARSVLAMGDDETDVLMFRAALELAKNDVHVLLAGISGGAETPHQISELADIMLRNTDEALEALETIARALGV